jgi:GNAT superfamily N-acetyltransferase
MVRIALAQTDADILRCFPVLAELRPHLTGEQFLERIRPEREAGCHLAFLEDAGEIRCVARYRFLENLAWGRFLYVDDLVTAEAARSKGWGQRLFDWLVGEARHHGCEQLHLDSGVQRFGAHRFYLRQGMDITCHHFALKLRGTAALRG